MHVTALATFRNSMERRGVIIQRGEKVDLPDAYAEQLIRDGLVARSGKMLEDFENKMLEDFEANKMPTTTETSQQRTQGYVGPSKDSETIEERIRGHENAGKEKEGVKSHLEGPTRGEASLPQEVIREAHSHSESLMKPKSKPGQVGQSPQPPKVDIKK